MPSFPLSLASIRLLSDALDPSKLALPTQPEEEDHVAAFKRMLDDILDNASTEESSLTSKVGLGFSSSSSSTYLSASSSAAADRARLSRSTTLGFLLPQPKSHFARVKAVRTESNVDSELLHKLEEQNNSLPPQVRLVPCLFVIYILSIRVVSVQRRKGLYNLT